MTIDMTFEHREEIIRKEERAEGRIEGRIEGREEGRTEGRAEGIVSTVKSLGGAREKAVEIIVKELDITETEAKEIVDRYWCI